MTRRRRALFSPCLALAPLAFACSGGATFTLYNGTPAAVSVAVGSRELSVAPEELQRVVEPLRAGTSVVVSGSGVVLETRAISEDEAGRNLIYNVLGASRLRLVDYTGMYECEGDTRASAPPLKILGSLEGESLHVSPEGHLLQRGEPFPRKLVGCKLPILRIEELPQDIGSRTEEEYLLGWLQAYVRAHPID